MRITIPKIDCKVINSEVEKASFLKTIVKQLNAKSDPKQYPKLNFILSNIIKKVFLKRVNKLDISTQFILANIYKKSES